MLARPLPIVTAVVGLLLTIVAVWAQLRFNADLAARELDHRVRDVEREIETRLRMTTLRMHSARAVLGSDPAQLQIDDLRRFAQSLDVANSFPDIQGFGLVRRVRLADEAGFVAERRRSDPGFTIQPAQAGGQDRYVVQFLDAAEGYQALVGLDLASSRNYRQAALDSMRSGRVAISGPAVATSGDGPRRLHFLLLLPVYDGGAAPDTAQAREAALVGWVCAPFAIDWSVRRFHRASDEFEMLLRDRSVAAAAEPFYASASAAASPAGGLSKRVTMSVFGGAWEAEFRASPKFITSLNLRDPSAMAAWGLALTLLLTGLVASRSNLRHRDRLLAAERANAAALFALSTDPIIGVSTEGRVNGWNPAAQRAFGYTAEEAHGMAVDQAVRSLPETLMASAVQAQRQQKQALPPFDAVLQHRGGASFDGSVALSPAIRADRPDGGNNMVMVIRDVSVQKASERRMLEWNAMLEKTVEERTAGLESTRRSLQTILDTVPIAIAYWDSHQINRFANETYHLLHDHPRGSVPGKHIEQAVGASLYRVDRPRIEAALQGEVQVFERKTEASESGRVRHHVVNFKPDKVGDEVQGFYELAHDITARKAAEEMARADTAELERRVEVRTNQLVQAREAAEAANRAKSAFLAAMSHEIRTPMNGVIGMVDVLAHSSMTEDQHDAVQTIRNSGLSLLGIIDEILDFSKIEAGSMEIERAPVALSELVESVGDTLLPLALERQVELNLFVSPQLPSTVWSDAVRLRALLYNLVGNAIKFSAGRPHKTGQVSVRVEIDPAGPPQVQLRVIDNGIGMAPKTLRHLFTPFSQADPSTTRRFGGTGLGLVICKRLAALMDGDIEVQSELGEGSTFALRLPLEAVEGSPLPDLADVAGVDCIVVNSCAQATDLQAYLEHAHARVHMAADARGAEGLTDGMALPVVIHPMRGHAPALVRLKSRYMASAANPHLLIERGRRRQVRVAAMNVLILDGDCLRRSAFLHAVAVAAGRMSPQAPPPAAPRPGDRSTPAIPTIADARARGQLVLVAEDDAINRKVILRQLGLLGLAAEVACDGDQALQLWRRGHYGLLVSDLHMPVMDGYALTEAIRREEAGAGRDRLPIIALTANALRGEEHHALAAGMDEYLTKPVQFQALKVAVERWLARPGGLQADDETAAAAPMPGLPVLDVDILKGIVGDDEATVSEFLGEYRKAAGELAAAISAALEAGQIAQVGSMAHRLKASSRSVGAMVLGDQCAALENACRIGAQSDVAQAVRLLEADLAEVVARLEEMLARANQ